MKWIYALPLLAILSGCTPKSGTSDNAGAAFTYSGGGPIEVVATTGMVADIARNLGGERVKIKTLMGPGVDPHLYKPTPADVRSLQSADMVLYNGLHLEGKIIDVL